MNFVEEDLTRHSNFRKCRRQHRESKLNLDGFMLEILDLFKFEPKKKYVEELEDTFDSDTTSISKSSSDEEREMLLEVVMIMRMRIYNQIQMNLSMQMCFFKEILTQCMEIKLTLQKIF